MTGYQRKGEQPLYASAEPFRAEIVIWLDNHYRRYHQDRTPGKGQPFDFISGLELLAANAHIPTRSLRAYASGERKLITLTNADRLSMALGISLWCLAEEFLPQGEAIERWIREKAPA